MSCTVTLYQVSNRDVTQVLVRSHRHTSPILTYYPTCLSYFGPDLTPPVASYRRTWQAQGPLCESLPMWYMWFSPRQPRC